MKNTYTGSSGGGGGGSGGSSRGTSFKTGPSGETSPSFSGAI